MITNFLSILRSLPKRRILLLLLLTAILTYITAIFFSGFFSYIVANSVTLSNLSFALMEIIGFRKYQALSDLVRSLSNIFILLTFIFYLYQFYRRELKKYFTRNLLHVMEQVGYIADGNFNHQINPIYNNELDHLANNINNIVLKLKEAMAEERTIEHTKNELITNVSHDLRTPLTSTIGYLGLVEQDKYRDEVELRHYTGIAYEKALSLEQLINELFEYTRMQDKRLILRNDSIDIAEILGQLITQNRLYVSESEMICREEISTGPMHVLGDGEKLARVFNNLIMNAIHYGKDGKYIDIEANDEDGLIVVTITNYGDQITRVDVPHIFDRFYRAEKSRSKHTGGSGLGLAIAKSIVEHHDGTIEVNSTIEKTNFIVKLKKIN